MGKGPPEAIEAPRPEQLAFVAEQVDRFERNLAIRGISDSPFALLASRAFFACIDPSLSAKEAKERALACKYASDVVQAAIETASAAGSGGKTIDPDDEREEARLIKAMRKNAARVHE